MAFDWRSVVQVHESSEQARMAEEGQMEQALWGRRDGRSWGCEGHEVVVMVVGRWVSTPNPLCQKQQAGLLIFK